MKQQVARLIIKTVFIASVLTSQLTTSRAEADVSASPSFVSFNSVPVGSHGGSQSVRIYNNGPDEVRSLSATDSCYSGINVQSYGCFGPLLPYHSCSIYVSFSPTREGYHSCTIRIGTELSTVIISVSGTATK